MPRTDEPSLLVTILIPLSVLSLAAGLLAGAGMVVDEALRPSGFMPGLGYALGLLILGAGNLLSCLFNALCWGLRYRPRWLRATLAVQALPAALYAAWGLAQLGDTWRDEQAGDQYAAIADAVWNDDVAALDTARQRCGERCQENSYTQPDALLLLASEAGAHRVARSLVGAGAVVPGLERGAMRPTTSLKSCEGFFLPSADALGVAVAHDDADMVHLLLPAASGHALSEALWLAAMLDRVELFGRLLAAGIAPHGPYPRNGAGNHLLSAAAAGASMRIGRQLLEAPPAPVGQADVQAAVDALFLYMEETDGQPRAVAFARLLAEHGADLDGPMRDETSFLAEAVRTGRKDMARQLIEAGANPARLAPDRQQNLQSLMRQADPDPYHANDGDCIGP